MFLFSKRKSSNTKVGPLDKLPDELLIKIFEHLKEEDFDRASKVSKRWRQISRSPQLLVQRHRLNISAGYGHCLLIHNGVCYSWGSNHQGQLGYTTNTSFSACPRRVSFLRKKPLAFISAGAISVGITRAGKSFSWGSLQVSTKRATVRDQLFNLFPIGRSFKNISVSYGHALAITQSGECYSWGINDFGQLGLSHMKATFAPQQIKAFKKKQVVLISTGSKHSLAVTQDGKCYAWGKNVRGELGLSLSDLVVLTPTVVEAFNNLSGGRVVCVSAGGFHSMAITQAGECYTWGSNRYGQLGSGCTLNASVPKKVVVGGSHSATQETNTTEVCFVKAAAGKCFSLALTRTGEMYAWGSNRYGQLGLGTTTTNANAPSLVSFFQNTHVMDISAGAGHSICLTKDLKCFSWGYNSEGQLGLGHTRNATEPQLVPVALRDDVIQEDVEKAKVSMQRQEGFGSFLKINTSVTKAEKKALKITKL